MGRISQESGILTFIAWAAMYTPFLWHYDASTQNTHVLGSPNDNDTDTSRGEMNPKGHSDVILPRVL